jgi:hypothetical protein
MAETNVTEGEVVESKGITPSVSSTLSVQELKEAVDVELQKREILINFVKSQLVENTDFGKIHINKNCPNKWDPSKCTVKGHFSKDTLYKPGMEKILSLMNLQSTLERDEDTIQMLTSTGYKTPTVAYKCVLARNGQILAEGRGAAEVGGNSRDVNSTIKIAEKRARMDATLSLGFSEFFTQDLEDMPLDDKKTAPENVDQETGEIKEPAPSQNKPSPGSPKQQKLAGDLLREKGAKSLGDVAKIMRLVGVKPTTLDVMDWRDIRKLIDYLFKQENAAAIRQALAKSDDVILTDLPEGDYDPFDDLDNTIAAMDQLLEIGKDLHKKMTDKFQEKGVTGEAAVFFSQATIGKPNPTTAADAEKLMAELDKLEK